MYQQWYHTQARRLAGAYTHTCTHAYTHTHIHAYTQSNGTRTFQGYRDLSPSRRITAGPSVSSVYLNTTAPHSCFSTAAVNQLERERDTSVTTIRNTGCPTTNELFLVDKNTWFF